MKFRLTLFFAFQIIAWTVYFNMDTGVLDPDIEGFAEKVVQVEEMSANQFASIDARKELYKIILRNDGFFTRINNDNSVEAGLWSVNRDIPSLDLRSPVGSQRFKILDNSGNVLKLELFETNDLLQVDNAELKESTLYSSLQ